MAVKKPISIYQGSLRELAFADVISFFNRKYVLFTDFVQSLTGGDSLNLTLTVTNGSTTSSVFETFNDSIDGVTRPRLGLVQLRNGGNRAALTWGASNSTILALITSFTEFSFRCSFRLQGGTLPNVTDNWGFYIGFGNGFAAGGFLPTTERYAVVRMPLLAEPLQTYKLTVCNAGGANTIVDTGVVMQGNVYEDFELSFKVTAGQRRVEALWYGSVVATILDTDPNFPSTANLLSVGMKNSFISGTLSRIVIVDSAQITVIK